jgi:hypothetical protein
MNPLRKQEAVIGRRFIGGQRGSPANDPQLTDPPASGLPPPPFLLRPSSFTVHPPPSALLPAASRVPPRNEMLRAALRPPVPRPTPTPLQQVMPLQPR